jgi:Spy/CpxP family protein refolding chaperone
MDTFSAASWIIFLGNGMSERWRTSNRYITRHEKLTIINETETMKTKSLLSLFAVALLLSVWIAAPAAAQRGPQERRANPEQRVERHMRMLDRQVDLSDAQEAQLKARHTEQREAVKAWMEANPNATREEKRAYRKEQAEAHREALQNVLTPEQQQILEEVKSARHHRSRGHMRRGQRGHRGFAGLDLTDTQKSQLQDLRQAHRTAMKAWMDANPNATREEKRAYHKEQAEAHRSTLENILTPEQQQILEERRAKRQDRWERRKGASDGALEDTGSADLNDTSSSQFALSNYPNPFNPSTEIRFTLPEASHVSLVVYDVQGREISTLVDEHLGAGEHAAPFNAVNLPTGTYLYRLTVGSGMQTGRMVLMK